MAVIFKLKSGKGKLIVDSRAKGTTRKNYKYNRIIDLGPDKVAMIEYFMFSGNSPLEVAKYVKRTWKVFLNMSDEFLTRIFRDYKKDILLPKILRAADSLPKQTKENALKTYEHQKDVIAGLSAIIDVQQDRVNKLLDYEKDLGKGVVMKTATRELRLLKDMYRELGRHQVQMGFVGNLKDGGIHFTQNNLIQQFNDNVTVTSQKAAATQKFLDILKNHEVGDFIDVATGG